MDIKQYEYYFTYDKPVPYLSYSIIKNRENLNKKISKLEKLIVKTKEQEKKLEKYKKEYDDYLEKNTLYIHPVLMPNYLDFYYSINCLVLEKNKIPDPNVISMSYLDFLFYLIQNDPNNLIFAQMLSNILNICCKIDVENIKYSIDEKNNTKLILNNIEYNKKDFDNIKKIICYQNMPDYNDEYIDPELEQALNEAEELKNKDNGTITLEDQLICVMISTSLKLGDIEKMSIRKFVKTLRKIDAKLHYQIYKTGECSGMVSFKEPVLHWMYSKDNRFDSLIEYNSFKNKMKNVAK